ncbi:MAG TPA: hypothetical protein VE153_15865 [Myxococcus sp.]|nr:hypothetical protein [Myxococcus sp.]
MCRIVLAASVALLLSGCPHWIRQPRVGPSPNEPSRVPRPNQEPLHDLGAEPSPGSDGQR